MERALLESEKNHELEMHELQSEMKQKLSEAESKVQMEVFQAISDTEREVRNMYEEKLRDADKEENPIVKLYLPAMQRHFLN